MSKCGNRNLHTMNCDNIKSLALEYFEEESNSENRKVIEDHLQNCRSCSHYYLFSKMNYLQIEKDKRTEIDPYFYSVLMAKIENQTNKSTILTRNPSHRLSIVAIILVITVFGGLLLGTYSASILNSNANIVIESNIVDDEALFDLANNEIDIFNNVNSNSNE